jgi:hypothetical protein
MLNGKTVVELDPGDHPDLVVIDLEDPPDWRRFVRCLGKIDTVRRVLIGSDDWSHTTINQQEYLTWAPDTWGEPPRGPKHTEWRPVITGDHAQRFNVFVTIELKLEQNLSLTATVTSQLCEDFFKGATPNSDQIVSSATQGPHPIAAGATRTFTFDHNSGNFPPDRGHVELRIENLRAPA